MARPEPSFHRWSSERQDRQPGLGNECLDGAFLGVKVRSKNWQVWRGSDEYRSSATCGLYYDDLSTSVEGP